MSRWLLVALPRFAEHSFHLIAIMPGQMLTTCQQLTWIAASLGKIEARQYKQIGGVYRSYQRLPAINGEDMLSKEREGR